MVLATIWLLAIVLGAAAFRAGYAKLDNRPMIVRSRERLGLNAANYQLIGVAEISAAFGILFSPLPAFRWIGFLSAFGLVLLMIGAIATHIRVSDPLSEAIPAMGMLLLSFLYLTAIAV